MEQLVRSLLPDALLGLETSMWPAPIDLEQYVSSLDAGRLRKVCAEYALDIPQLTGEVEPCTRAPDHEDGVAEPAAGASKGQREDGRERWPRRQRFKNFAVCGVAPTELNAFYAQISAGVVHSAGEADDGEAMSEYITPRQASEIYKINAPECAQQQLEYLGKLALLREDDLRFMSFAANVMLRFEKQLARFPLTLKIALLAQNEQLALHALESLDAALLADVLVEFLPDLSKIGVVLSFYAERASFDFFSFLMANCSTVQAAQALELVRGCLERPAAAVRLVHVFVLIIESDYEQEQKPSKLQENAAVFLLCLLGQLEEIKIFQFCSICSFSLEEGSCARCQMFYQLSDSQFSQLIRRQDNFFLIQDIMPQSGEPESGQSDLSGTSFSEYQLLGYALKCICAETVAAKLLTIFLIKGRAASAQTLLREFGRFVQKCTYISKPAEIQSIFQIALESESTMISDQAVHFLVQLLDSNDLVIANVVQMLLSTLIIVSVKKIELASVKSKVLQLGGFLREIVYKTVLKCFVNENEVGISLILNLAGSAVLQLNERFTVDFACSEANAVQLMRLLERRQNFVNRDVQNALGFALLGTLTDENVFAVPAERFQQIADWALILLTNFSGERLQAIFLFDLLHTVNYLAQRLGVELRTEKVQGLLLGLLGDGSSELLRQEGILKQLFAMLRRGRSPERDFFIAFMGAKNSFLRCLALQLLSCFDREHAQKYREQLLSRLGGVKAAQFALSERCQQRLSELYAVQYALPDMQQLKDVDVSSIPEVAQWLGDALLTPEKAYFDALALVQISADMSSAAFNDLVNSAKQKYQSLAREIAAKQAADSDPRAKIFALKLAHVGIVSGFALPQASFELLLPALLQCTNDAILHQAKACCYQLIQRYGRRAAWREIFRFIQHYSGAKTDIGVLTWLFVFQECAVHEDARKLFFIDSQRLMCQLVFVWFQGQFRASDKIRQWLEENCFVKDVWKLIFAHLFEHPVYEVGEFLRKCGF